MLPDFPEAEAIAWSTLAIVSVGFSCVAAVLHLRPIPSRPRVVRYEPPACISPSLAAYLRQNGRSERAFAAGIVSLAEQSQLSIEPTEGLFRLTKLCPPVPPTAKDEAALLKLLFAHFSQWFDDRPLSSLASDFEKELEKIACPELISPHSGLWVLGTAACIISIPLLFLAGKSSRSDSFSLGFVLYAFLFIGLGVLSLTAALRAWPATLEKFRSKLPGGTASKLRFTASDLTPVFLTSSALIGFGVLAAVTSAQLSVFVALVVTLSFVFRHLLEAPSRKGREILGQLEDFREFLSRTDSDRLSRQDTMAPHSPERYGAYALALGVEKGWREQFADAVFERIELERVCGAGDGMVDPPVIQTHQTSSPLRDHHSFIELNLRDPK